MHGVAVLEGPDTIILGNTEKIIPISSMHDIILLKFKCPKSPCTELACMLSI